MSYTAQAKVGKNTIITVAADTQRELFKELASAQEVFGEQACGLCKSEDIVFAHRTVTQGKKTFEYSEMHCKKCHARLSFGCMQEGGGLFPVRKLMSNGKPNREEGTYGTHNGWTKYRGEKNEEETK